MEFEQWRKYQVKLVFRETYKGRPLKPGLKERDGEIIDVEYGWTMDDDEKYPGEVALIPVERMSFEKEDLYWIASGDVEVIKEI